MHKEELVNTLNRLLALPSETECVEFKKAATNFHFDKLGKYFSALSNEANLKNKQFSWLVLGIEDKSKKITGTAWCHEKNSLNKLIEGVADKTNGRLTFVDIHDLRLKEGRVLMFQIPAAPQGIPVSWEGHYYGRDGEALVGLNIQEIEQIRSQTKSDWSSTICEDATIDDLANKAIEKARIEYSKKYPSLAKDAESWDDLTFLNKAKITIQGKITKAAIILLGKPESTHFISPSVAQISWILRNDKNIEKDYEHFDPPFILSTDAVLNKIRNLNYRFLSDETLFPQEITQYDTFVIREALHNCIAHQNYELQGRINVVEYPDELLFSNLGSFIPQTVDAVIEQNAPQEYYRNRCRHW